MIRARHLRTASITSLLLVSGKLGRGNDVRQSIPYFKVHERGIVQSSDSVKCIIVVVFFPISKTGKKFRNSNSLLQDCCKCRNSKQ